MIEEGQFCQFSCHEHELTFTESTLLKSKWNQTIFDYNYEMDRYCRCDDECNQYGDCCFDALSSSNGREVMMNNKDSLTCLPLRLDDYGMFDQKYYIYMIGNCPMGWSGDESLPDLCQRKAKVQDYSHLLDVPVFSNRTNVTYANIYCAKCHSDTAHLAIWNSWVECDEDLESLNISRQVVFDPSNYQPGLRRWSTLVNGLSVNCHLFVQQFQKFDNYIESTGSRKCLPAITNCATNWTDPSVEVKCNDYALYVQSHRTEEKLIYKNPHCAKCNYVPDNEQMFCYRKNETTIVKSRIHNEGRDGYSFSMLIDFEFGGGRKGGKTDKCGIDQIYDHLHDRCHTIACSFKQGKDVGTCLTKTIHQDENFDIMPGNLNSSCQRLNLQEKQDFFLENGTLILNQTGQRFLPEEYELTVDGKNASICAEGRKPDTYFQYSEGQNFLSDICLAISVVCLALHIAIYAALPKLLNLPGQSLLSLSCALFIAQLLFLTGIGLRETIGYGFCAAMGILTHWSYLSAFFWMNVMGFDICRTFAGSLTRNRRMPGNGQRTTFRYYSLYAWGFPTLIVLLGISLDLNHLDEELNPLFGNHNPSCWMDNWAPAYGVRNCWISNRIAFAIFFVVPVTVLLLSNVILFSITVFNILKQKREAKFALEKNQSYRKPENKKQSSMTKQFQVSSQRKKKRSNKTHNRFILYTKLLLIMGLGWVFGFVAILAKVPILWYPFIFFNSLQGAFIFATFSCKRKVYYMIYYWATNQPHPNDPLSCSRATASSNKSCSVKNQRISYAASSSSIKWPNANEIQSVYINTSV